MNFSWFAGYMDGDGFICLIKRTGYLSREPVIGADSTDIEILEYIKSEIGGYILQKKKYKEHHRQAYCWRLKGKNRVVPVLRETIPFMRCMFKKERSVIIVDNPVLFGEKGVRTRAEDYPIRLELEEKFLALGEGRGRRSYTPLVSATL